MTKLYPIDTLRDLSRRYAAHDVTKVDPGDFNREIDEVGRHLTDLDELEESLRERRADYGFHFGSDAVTEAITRLPAVRRRLTITQTALILYRPRS